MSEPRTGTSPVSPVSSVNSVAVVTGAGSGMGRSTAQAFLAQGWTVLAVDVAPADPIETDGRLIPVVVDVRDRSAVDAALSQHLPGLGGQLHAVANVAGIYPPSTLETFTTDLFHRVFGVNVLGVLNIMAACAPYMPAGSGIVNFASVDGFVVSPGQLVYGASKAAVVMITKATALELAPRDPGQRHRAGLGRHPGQRRHRPDGTGRRRDPPRSGRPARGDRSVGVAAHRRRSRVLHDRRHHHPLRRRRHPLITLISPPTKGTMIMTRYCVIGAGAAGLSALQQLRKAGYDVDCYETTDRVAGHWNTDYDALHLITARDQTFFEDFPMPKEYPHFPRRDQVRAYMEAYARHFGLDHIIRFNTPVASVTPITTDGAVGRAGWTVTLENGEQHDYDGVLVANGHLWDQKIPAFEGEFTGKQIHSGSYTNTSAVDGDRVLVVGAGNSACDLAVDCAQHRLEIDIVIREGIYFQPKAFFGVPRQQVGFLSEFSPSDQDLIARLLARVSIGEWFNYPGMPQPKHDTLAGGSTVVNDLLLYWIQHGRIKVRPGISRFDGTTVHHLDFCWSSRLQGEPAVHRRVAAAAAPALRRRHRAAGPGEALLHRSRCAPRSTDSRLRRADQARDPDDCPARAGR